MKLHPTIKTYLDEHAASEVNDHKEVHASLRAGLAAIKLADKYRKSGNPIEAAGHYDRAVQCLLDSGLAWDRNEELGRAVKGLTDGCRTKARNCRHPVVRRAPATIPAPLCLCCRKKLRRYKREGMFYGQPAEWGDYGDNAFCGVACAARWARWAVGSGALRRPRP